MTKQTQPYGTWDSPITPHTLAGSIRLNDVQWDSDGETLVWHERRGDDGVLVARYGTTAMRDLTDSKYSVRGRVGYGGGDFSVHQGIVYFASRGRLYRLALSGGAPQPITPEFGAAAAPRVSPDGRWVAFVHSYEDDDVLALVDSEGRNWPQKIASGYDFIMQPAWHPDGTKLAYIAWNHPQMPWNGTELRLLTLEYDAQGRPWPAEESTLVGDTETAIFQPEFSPDGRYLAYISDATGWGHLYLYDLQTGQHRQLTQGNCEHGVPAWIQGLRTYAWTADSRALYIIRSDQAFESLWLVDPDHEAALHIREFDRYTALLQIAVSPVGEKLALLASSSTLPPRVLTYSAESGVQIARRASTESVPATYCSPVQAITWQGHDGESVHGLYYAPQHPDYTGKGAPPLMVMVHGGPTSHSNTRFELATLYFTTRGYAVLHINHRGSTGYGKAYMNKHQGCWGVYDVQDSISGAQHLVNQGLAHPDKLVIMGGSAGGYTVLQALVDKPGFFKAGVCLYGVANQFTLVMDTHKFESRYSDWLLGELPDAADVYRDRSPLFKAECIKDALIVFQGEKDVVVPKNQSDAIVAALRRSGTPHEYHVYEGEGHGFRKPETLIDFYEKVANFLLQYVIYA